MKVIGICGNAPGVGKSTFASILGMTFMDRAAGSCRFLSFARPLKRAVAEMFGIDSGTTNKDSIITSDGRTYRDALVFVGNVMREQWDDYIWINRLDREIQAIRGHQIAIIDDLRYPNEEQYLRDLKSSDTSTFIIKIHRTSVITPDHPGEGNYINADFHVYNYEAHDWYENLEKEAMDISAAILTNSQDYDS